MNWIREYWPVFWCFGELLFWSAGIFYVGGPVLVWLTMKWPAVPRLEPVLDTDDMMMPRMEEAFRESAAGVIGAGFQLCGYLRMPRTAGSESVVAVFEHPSTGVVAQMMGTMGSVSGGVRLANAGLVFSSYFADGVVVQTANLQPDTALAQRPGFKAVAFPGVRDAEQLYGIHLAMARKFGTGRTMRTDVARNATEFLVRDWKEVMERQVKAGYLQWSQGSAMYRPTVKGTLLMTYKFLWPWKGILRWRNRREARRLLGEFGLSPKWDETKCLSGSELADERKETSP